MKKCVSCGRYLMAEKAAVIFPCPECGEELGRCTRCKKLSVKYICPKCGFQGP